MHRSTVYLAALLHDIGKFYQRADENGAARSAYLSASVKNLEGQYCPVYQGQYSHKHVLWTAQFFEDHATFYKRLLQDDFGPCYQAAVAHHRPQKGNYWQELVQKADHYASGCDRTGEAGMRDAEAENRWDSFKNVRMVSIFEGLLRENHAYSYELPISELKVSKDFFPSEKIQEPGQPAYRKLWEQFQNAIKLLHERNFSSVEHYCDNLYYILHLFLVHIPSSTKDLPDVSLFDHSKVTAGFAVCLDAYLKALGKTNCATTPDESPVLLVGGDFSGIQNYLYDIVSSDAAKNLKGRSFYLQLLSDNVVRRLLRALGLPIGCVVYSSGGGFFLLAPNTEASKKILETERQDISNLIFKEHKTTIFLSIDWQEVTEQRIMTRALGDIWKGLMEKLNRNKRNKFKSALVKQYADFFKPIEVGGKQKRDSITNEELSDEESAAADQGKKRYGIQYIDDDNTKPVRFTTYEQIELGKSLKNTLAWVVSDQELPESNGLRKYQFCNLGVFNYLLEDKESAYRLSLDGATVLALRHDDESLHHIRKMVAGKDVVEGFSFYGGNDYPDENGAPLSFDKLAEKGIGVSKLGVLRMDVDNLGSIFKDGLGKDKKTFSRYSTLSRSLDYFFRGYLNEIWREEAFCKSTYILYSGGDDLFIVGHWNALVGFAQRIRDEFANYTCQNPKLSLSGGLAIVPPKFPIAKGASMADQAEKAAKSYEQKALNLEKNAFALLGIPLYWDTDFKLVQELKNKLAELLDAKKLPQGVLHKLMQYQTIAEDQKKHNLNESWYWHMAYDFSRAKDRAQDKVTHDFYDRVREAAYTECWEKGKPIESKHDFLTLLATAARWVELEKR